MSPTRRRQAGRFFRAVWVLVLLGAAVPASAHQLHPALLRLEPVDGRLQVTFKRPFRDGRPLPVSVELPCDASPARVDERGIGHGGVRTERWWARCDQSLAELVITARGLDRARAELLVMRVDDQGTTTRTLTADAPSWAPASPVQHSWVVSGVEHILFGIDHLLFVLGLLLVVHRPRTLITTITAFTVGHSVTLAAASLGWMHVHIGYVETLIALSIVMLAAEAFAGHGGLVTRRPWLVAGLCGLFHGLGFASALDAVGLPDQGVVSALVRFNVGVELGQLAFVGVVIGVIWTLRRVVPATLRYEPALRATTAWGMGVCAAYWTWDRALDMF